MSRAESWIGRGSRIPLPLLPLYLSASPPDVAMYVLEGEGGRSKQGVLLKSHTSPIHDEHPRAP